MLYTEFITQKNINAYKNKKLSKNQSLSINMTIFCAEKSINQQDISATAFSS
jgi:hypothetical protein